MVVVTVTSPKIQDNGRNNKFTIYRVNTNDNFIYRRYSDFIWLYNRLGIEVPGAIIPIIHHKRALTNAAKFDEQFVEQRRQQLQIFLQTVVNHYELARAPSMTPFMTLQLGEAFDTARAKLDECNSAFDMSSLQAATAEQQHNNNNFSSSDPAARKAVGQGFSRLFATAKTLTKAAITGSTDSFATTPEEEDINNLRDFAQQVEKSVQRLQTLSTAFTQSTLDRAKAMSDMAQPIEAWKLAYQTTLRTNEESLGVLSAVSEFTTDLGTMLEAQAVEEADKYMERLELLVNHVKAVQVALRQRKELQVTYSTQRQQFLDKEVAFQTALKNLKPPEVTDKLQMELATLKEHCKVSKERLEQSSKRLVKDAAREAPLLQKAFQEAMNDYAKVQIKYNKLNQQAWEQLLPYVEPEPATSSVTADPDRMKEEQGNATA